MRHARPEVRYTQVCLLAVAQVTLNTGDNKQHKEGLVNAEQQSFE